MSQQHEDAARDYKKDLHKQEKDALLLLRRRKNLYRLQSRWHYQRTVAAADHTHDSTSSILPVRMRMQ
jgi:hypothetical protein